MSENSPKLPNPESPSSIEIGLGDIVQIIAPTNSAINEQICSNNYSTNTNYEFKRRV